MNALIFVLILHVLTERCRLPLQTNAVARSMPALQSAQNAPTENAKNVMTDIYYPVLPAYRVLTMRPVMARTAIRAKQEHIADKDTNAQSAQRILIPATGNQALLAVKKDITSATVPVWPVRRGVPAAAVLLRVRRAAPDITKAAATVISVKDRNQEA